MTNFTLHIEHLHAQFSTNNVVKIKKSLSGIVIKSAAFTHQFC